MSIIYIEEGHAANILQQMWQDCETDQFCDVVVIAGAEEIKIPAHRSVLSSATAYFKGMFSSFLESMEKEIKITELDGHALKSLIQFIYTGRVEIREDNVQDLLEAADMLLLNNVVAACGNFLSEQLDPANCLGFTLLAERFRCQSLLEYAKKYSLEHFMKVYKTQEFLKLNAEQLGQLLESDYIHVTSEEHVFNSLLLWLEHDRCEREKYKDDLLKYVRMPLLDPKFLFVHVKPICTSTESYQVYIEVMEWQLTQGTSTLNPNISRKPRRPSQYLIGITQTNKKMFIRYYCPHQLKWMKWMNNLEYRSFFGVATMGHNVYIVGGKDAQGNRLNTVLCLNMQTMTFSPVNAMTERREACSAVVLNGFLYVAGGYDGRHALSSVEKWDPTTNAWHKVASMSVSRAYFRIAKMNKKLCAVGGRNTGPLSSTEIYDPDQNVWTSIAPMQECRCFHGIAVADDVLYAIGGSGLKTFERYDSLTNQWSNITSLREILPANGYSCTTFNEKVVVCYKDRVDEYDATTNEWKTSESLKGLPNLLSIFTYSGELLTTEFVEN